MQSKRVYETSLNEIKAIEKRLAFDTVTINMGKLDGQTKNDMIQAIANVLASRKQAVIDTIAGATL